LLSARSLVHSQIRVLEAGGVHHLEVVGKPGTAARVDGHKQSAWWLIAFGTVHLEHTLGREREETYQG
jgi:hypothetical protein